MLTHFISMEICTSYIFYRNCEQGIGFFRLSPFESAMPIREGSSRAADHFERVMRVRSVQLVAFLLMLPHDAFASGARNILSS